jgi:hypothetical protein
MLQECHNSIRLPPDWHSPHNQGRADNIIGGERTGRKIPVKECRNGPD